MPKSLKLIIESLLFSSDKPLTVREIRSCLPDVEAQEIKNSLKILEHEYEMMDRSFKLKEVAKGYQFRSRSEYGAYILRLLQSTPNRLSRAAMETLAIIAYKQPILRHEIERLRGVDVGGILKTLLEKELIRIMGRKDLPGRPLIYGTTKRFLEVFDLKDLSDLPKLKEIKDFGTEEFQPSPVGEEQATDLPEQGEAPEKETPGGSEEAPETEIQTESGGDSPPEEEPGVPEEAAPEAFPPGEPGAEAPDAGNEQETTDQ